MAWQTIKEKVKFYDLDGKFVTELDIPIQSLIQGRLHSKDPIVRLERWSGEADIPDDHGLEGDGTQYLVRLGSRFTGTATVKYLKERYEVPAYIVIWGDGPLEENDADGLIRKP